MTTPVGTEHESESESTGNQAHTKDTGNYGVARSLGGDTGGRERRFTLRTLPATIQQLVGSRRFMAGVTALGLLLYLWNAPRAIDYPEYDEADYFFKGYRLTLGDIKTADIFNIHSSPVSPIYYALWYLLLHSSLLYPWVMASSLFLMGMGAYLLLSRVLHPTLSLVLALFAVMASAPFAPGNANFYLGAGILWLSLSLLDKTAWSRGLAALGVLVAMYERPEFVLVLALLLILLVVYERRQLRRGVVSKRGLARAYAPLALGMVLTAYLLLSSPAGSDYRSAAALPYSYNVYLEAEQYPGFSEATNYANPWILFEKDFGPVQPRTLQNTLLAMLHNPPKMEGYFAFEVWRLWTSFGTALFSARSWVLNEWATKLPVGITPQQSQLLFFGLLLFLMASAASYWWLRRKKQLARVRVRLHIPALIGMTSLAPLVSILILINPTAIFFFLFPLVLVLVGLGVSLILTALVVALGDVMSSLPRTAGVVARPLAGVLVVILVLLALPHPYATTGVHPIGRTVEFLRTYVPAGSTIIGEPVISYGDFLAADGLDLHTISLANYPDSGMVGAFEANPALGYVLLTRLYPQSTYDQWFADWRATFPQMSWTRVAALQDPNVQLYALPSHGAGYGRVSYALWVLRARKLGMNPSVLPPFDAIDFDHLVNWQSANPGHYTDPLVQGVGGVPAKSFVMHPSYPGIDAYHDVSSQVKATLPATWSGHTLIFFAALAPWAADQPTAKGTRLTFSAGRVSFSQTVEILNDAPPHWLPILIHLPQFNGPLTVTISIQPRVSIQSDTTLVSFIGVTQNSEPSAP